MFDYKKLFIPVIILIAVWLIAYFFVVDSIKNQTADLRVELQKARTTIGSTRGVFIDENSIKKITEEQKRMESKLTEIKQKILFKIRPIYQIDPSSQDLVIRFNTLLTGRYSDMRKRALTKGIKFPASLGFPAGTLPAAEMPLYYERLDIIDQVVSLLVEKGCREINSIDMEKGVRDFLDASVLTNEFTKKDIIVIKLKGDFKSVAEVINTFYANFAKGERFLALSRVSLQSDNPEVDLLTMTLAFGSVKIK